MSPDVGTGIGRAIFDRLLDDGWAVVGLEMQEGLAATAHVRAGAQGDVLLGDVAQTANLEAAADRAQQFAPLRGWVNNAALALSSNLHEPDVARIERVISVNLMGYFWGCFRGDPPLPGAPPRGRNHQCLLHPRHAFVSRVGCI